MPSPEGRRPNPPQRVPPLKELRVPPDQNLPFYGFAAVEKVSRKGGRQSRMLGIDNAFLLVFDSPGALGITIKLKRAIPLGHLERVQVAKGCEDKALFVVGNGSSGSDLLVYWKRDNPRNSPAQPEAFLAALSAARRVVTGTDLPLDQGITARRKVETSAKSVFSPQHRRTVIEEAASSPPSVRVSKASVLGEPAPAPVPLPVRPGGSTLSIEAPKEGEEGDVVIVEQCCSSPASSQDTDDIFAACWWDMVPDANPAPSDRSAPRLPPALSEPPFHSHILQHLSVRPPLVDPSSDVVTIKKVHYHPSLSDVSAPAPPSFPARHRASSTWVDQLFEN